MRDWLIAVVCCAIWFAAGFGFDRWLHRPIEIHCTSGHVSDPPAAEPPAVGIFPPGQDVCTAFTNICWMRI